MIDVSEMLEDLKNGALSLFNSQAFVTWIICSLVSYFYCFYKNQNSRSMIMCFTSQFIISLVVLLVLFSFPAVDNYIGLTSRKSSFISANKNDRFIPASSGGYGFFQKKTRPVEIY